MDLVNKQESKYERLRRIGIGSPLIKIAIIGGKINFDWNTQSKQGVVFKCVNRQTGQIVAIKRYSENDSDPIIRKIAMREVRMLRQLKHPNLINLIEVFRRKRRLHLVFDYCELTVLDVIEKYTNNCPLNLIKKIIWQTVNGINYCHKHNCIHRDIKPENILINQAGVVKICDFGFARNISNITNNDNSTSLAGMIKRNDFPAKDNNKRRLSDIKNSNKEDGSYNQEINNNNNQMLSANDRQALTEYVATRWYRAPELLIGEMYYDIKIDIWAIGCVTAELMRGQPIWPGETDVDQICIIKKSLGQLTQSQVNTLMSQNIYDQPTVEKILAQTETIKDSLDGKLPLLKVGLSGFDFVSSCLQMDPAKRPTSDELLKHPYIHSARMSQFVINNHQATPPPQQQQQQPPPQQQLLSGRRSSSNHDKAGTLTGSNNNSTVLLDSDNNSNNSNNSSDKFMDNSNVLLLSSTNSPSKRLVVVQPQQQNLNHNKLNQGKTRQWNDNHHYLAGQAATTEASGKQKRKNNQQTIAKGRGTLASSNSKLPSTTSLNIASQYATPRAKYHSMSDNSTLSSIGVANKSLLPAANTRHNSIGMENINGKFISNGAIKSRNFRNDEPFVEEELSVQESEKDYMLSGYYKIFNNSDYNNMKDTVKVTFNKSLLPPKKQHSKSNSNLTKLTENRHYHQQHRHNTNESTKNNNNNNNRNNNEPTNQLVAQRTERKISSTSGGKENSINSHH